ncbi:LysR family transcriptional regulator [Aureimonas sp. AU22]|uniref:LysR family transcriptional regulator n=1 Tax=Aureimonas sp. AU22 TaxID=1638162 RepID=UPI000781E043|nr:LysR family transcriptional regulator [Aureimonas sp. AU22]
MSRRVDPYSLRLFLTVAQEGSIARAAEREHIAPSALSRRIADLEQALGAPLLVRSPRGIKLTDAGEIALSRGTRLESELNALAREVQARSGTLSGTLRVLATPSAIVGYLPERLRAFRDGYPAVDVALQECSTQEVVRGCLDDRADVGIGMRTEAPSGVESWFFCNDPFIVVLPRGHPSARRQAMTLAELAAHPLISIQAGGSLDRTLRAKASEAGLKLDVRVVVTSFDAVCRMVEVGLGIAVLPQGAASAYAGTDKFVRRTLAEDWSQRELRLYALRKTPRLPSADAFMTVMRGEPSQTAMPPAPP